MKNNASPSPRACSPRSPRAAARPGRRGGSLSLRSSEERGSEDIRALIRETIEQTAARGKAVIVAHAASYAVDRRPSALRVLVTASPDKRAARVADAEGLDQAGGVRAVKDSDAGRADYL